VSRVIVNTLKLIFGTAVTIVFVPLFVIWVLLGRPFDRPVKLTPEEVRSAIANFISNTGGEWNWDDFISVPIADSALDSIRNRVAVIDPRRPDALAALNDLLAEAEALCQPEG